MTQSSQAMAPLVEDAVALADRWAQATERGQTQAERQTSGQLAALLRDEAGLDLAVRFVDRVARPEDTAVAAKELGAITAKDASSFLEGVDLALLSVGARIAPLAPPIVVPLARKRLRQIVGHLVVDAHDPALRRHLAQARADGFRLNVNLLGEAVLGESEAASRTARVGELLARPDVDYVSIKVSALVSQIVTWDTEGTVRRCLQRLRPLYRIAKRKAPHAFVNLDMEEYRDLDLTMELFRRLLSEEEFCDLAAGIALQGYLPDALPALERLIEFAADRRARGGAGIKVRLVKGANLAMEHVEAVLHGWEQAPYPSKEEVDANYLRCVERALRPDAAAPTTGPGGERVGPAVRLGCASHNLYDIALAHLLARRRGVTDSLDIEMLQGMAPAQARAVRDDVGAVVLYTPVVAPKDVDVAVSYLIRRLEENAQPQNFLHAIFSGVDESGRGGPMAEQARRFRDSVTASDTPSIGPRRSPERRPIPETFTNTPDSDPSLAQVRRWATEAVNADPAPLSFPVVDTVEGVEDVVRRGREAAAGWAARPGPERAAILRQAARRLEDRRGDLLTVMAAEGGKTIAEADPEISEAIDFAGYYAESALDTESGLSTDGARFEPARLTLITPPWNFPVAIPIGGVLAALAAGSAVVIKPAHPTPGCVEVACAALHDAGVPGDVLQVVRTGERAAGKALVSHPDVDIVVLTGSSETATMFTGWRVDHPGGPRVYGETSGKNAMVITPAADLDLAVADLVQSAFGHAGQKCSAASLAILVGSVGSSKRFRRQLIDAVESLKVGWPDEVSTTMGPVIEEPSGKLLRALTTLEPGETWLVKPERLDDSGRLWSPGLKDGVAADSFYHLNEVFGPVLGLMRARTLTEALALQNGTAYGLTGGLQSLDDDEIAQWSERVEVGNAYVNRVTTGAIVRRQSFGGWKGSAVGPGAKAGGPNYVAQLGTWVPDGEPTRMGESSREVRTLQRELMPLLTDRSDRTWLRAAVGSDAYAWQTDLGREQDESQLVVEANVFRYRPYPLVWVRSEPGSSLAEILRVILAARTTGTPIRVSLDPGTSAALKARGGTSEDASAALRTLARFVDRAEAREDFVARVGSGAVGGRIRVVGGDAALTRLLAEQTARSNVCVLHGPVLQNGRRELLTLLREQAVSRTMHRFGHLALDAR